MIIEKTAKQRTNAWKQMFFYESARRAFENVLKVYAKQKDVTLFIPAYIGISSNEGSGIFDPIVKVGINYKFYFINRNLDIDGILLKDELNNTKGKKLVLLVHYFGYPDANIDSIVKICRANSAIIIEDAAHALYTDYVDHKCGNYGDYIFYSLHKMLPFENGGALKINNSDLLDGFKLESEKSYPMFNYDLYEISKIRKHNAKIWYDLLKNHTKYLHILRPYSNDVTPQTFPIIIKRYDRNKLYFKLNEAGFGAVSLYHTMIEPIQKEEYANSIWISQHIINLPVHQDVKENQIFKMAKILLEILYDEEIK